MNANIWLRRPSGLVFGTDFSGARSNSPNGVSGTMANGAAIVSGYGSFAGAGQTGPGNSATDTYPKLDIDGVLAIIPNLSDITISAWIYVTTLGRRGAIFSTADINHTAAGNYLSVRVNIDNTLQFIATDSAGAGLYSAVTSATVAANTWYHVAFVGKSASTKLYLNGVDQTLTYTAGSASTDGRWEAGATAGARDDVRFGGFFYLSATAYYNQSFTGRIAFPQILTSAKAAAEIAQEYNAGAARIAAGGTP